MAQDGVQSGENGQRGPICRGSERREWPRRSKVALRGPPRATVEYCGLALGAQGPRGILCGVVVEGPLLGGPFRRSARVPP
eukprot:5914383-Pyramimonas_sp.AAC.1